MWRTSIGFELAVRRIAPIVFALMVLAPSVAFARSEYLCRFDGQVRLSCCCPATAPADDASAREACCCTLSEGASFRAQPATEDHRPGSPLHQPALVAAVATNASALRVSVSATAPRPRSTAPPDCPRDLFVRHCALLL
jgi:hypothetical protein